MKTIHALIVVVALVTGYFTYQNSRPRSVKEPPVVEVIEEPAPPAPEPIVIPVAEPEKPKVEIKQELLPEGSFYTRERIKEVHEDGIKAIPAGVEVKKVGEEPGKTVVIYNKVTFKVDNYKLTNDAGEAGRLAERFKVTTPSFHGAVTAMAEEAVNQLSKTQPPTTPPVAPKVKVDNSAQIAVIDSQIKNLEEQIRDLESKDRGARGLGRVSGHGPGITRLRGEITKLNQLKYQLSR